MRRKERKSAITEELEETDKGMRKKEGKKCNNTGAKIKKKSNSSRRKGDRERS